MLLLVMAFTIATGSQLARCLLPLIQCPPLASPGSLLLPFPVHPFPTKRSEAAFHAVAPLLRTLLWKAHPHWAPDSVSLYCFLVPSLRLEPSSMFLEQPRLYF